ncbi:uncharacterized protein DAT39_019226, partial [Clarias magur]
MANAAISKSKTIAVSGYKLLALQQQHLLVWKKKGITFHTGGKHVTILDISDTSRTEGHR